MMELDAQEKAAQRVYRVCKASWHENGPKLREFSDANEAADFAQRSARRAGEYRSIEILDGNLAHVATAGVAMPSGQLDLTFAGSPLIRCQPARPDDFLSMMQ